MKFSVRQPITDEEFKHYYHLRWRRLRAPWGQAEGTETDDIEAQCFHLISITDQEQIIGVSRLQFNDHNTAQIRYMAVEDGFEGIGVGRLMVSRLEQHARDNNHNHVFLHAREPAVPFYQGLGYSITEPSYLLFDEIQHFHMEKRLL